MNSKLISAITVIVLLVGVLAIFTTIAYAKNSDFLCSKKQIITVTLKDEANVDASKSRILEMPKIKIVNIQYRDKEWSRMVNRMDLPKMENPFKNEITIKTKKNADIEQILKELKEMTFVEKVEYIQSSECTAK